MLRSLAVVVGLYLDDLWLWAFTKTCGRKRSPGRNRQVRQWRGGF